MGRVCFISWGLGFQRWGLGFFVVRAEEWHLVLVALADAVAIAAATAAVKTFPNESPNPDNQFDHMAASGDPFLTSNLQCSNFPENSHLPKSISINGTPAFGRGIM